MVRFPPSSQSWRRWFAFVLAGLVAFVAACGGKTDAEDMPAATLDRGDSSTTVVEETSTTKPELTVEEEVEAAYLEANRVFFSLMEDLDQPLDRVHETRTGESLEAVLASVERLKKTGERSSYPTGYPSIRVLDVEIVDGGAVVTACEQNAAVVTAQDGSVINDDRVTMHLEAEMEEDEGVWKVSVEYLLEELEGEVSCDG